LHKEEKTCKQGAHYPPCNFIDNRKNPNHDYKLTEKTMPFYLDSTLEHVA